MEVFKQTVAGNVLVGTYSCFSNRGGLVSETWRRRGGVVYCVSCVSVKVHPKTKIEDQDELSSLLQVPLVVSPTHAGTDTVSLTLYIHMCCRLAR